MRILLFMLGLLSHVSFLHADNTEEKIRTMVSEVQAAVQDEKSPNLKEVERIIGHYCNMDTVCTTVAKPYLLQETQGMDRSAKKDYISQFLSSFKPVYTAYLARVWASETNAKTFKNYDLEKYSNKDGAVMLTFIQKSNQEKSYISLVLDDKGFVTSIKFGDDKANMIDPIAADRDNCQAGMSKGKTPLETFS